MARFAHSSWLLFSLSIVFIVEVTFAVYQNPDTNFGSGCAFCHDNVWDNARTGKLLNMVACFCNGVNINAVDSSKNSALHYAAWNGNYDIVTWLCEHGANPNLMNDFGQTDGFSPLHYACSGGHKLVRDYLCNHCGGDFETCDQWTMCRDMSASHEVSPYPKLLDL